jgi:hypothetical protein
MDATIAIVRLKVIFPSNVIESVELSVQWKRVARIHKSLLDQNFTGNGGAANLAMG